MRLVASLVLGTVVVAAGATVAQTPPAAQLPPLEAARLELKYVRDSAEYATLTRQVFRQAALAAREAGVAAAGRAWAVSVDVDETALDNSVYQLERAAYRLPFDNASWNAWVVRGEAVPVPGVAEFVRAVRQAGGRIAWITNRDEIVREATRRNLAAFGLWHDGDRLCLAREGGYTKAVRRREVITGQGACAWAGTRTDLAVFVGDQMGDFPLAGEDIRDAGQDTAFGTRFFLLPNPTYGAWTTRVTRPAAEPR